MTDKKLRIASVSFSLTGLENFADFSQRITKHVNFAADSKAEMIVFPEYVTASLVSVDQPWEHWDKLYLELFENLAVKHKINILGGTHLFKKECGRYTNSATFFSTHGRAISQDKWHLTPFEREYLPFEVGNNFAIIKTESATFGIAICYDVEFPEFVRAISKHGIDVLLVPSCTDDTQGFWRVRYCSAARCIENQIAVVHAPLVGSSEKVRFFEQNCGLASVLVPCDYGFASQGIAMQGEWNQDSCVVAELDIAKLRRNRIEGSVLPTVDLRLKDYENGIVKNF